MELSSASIDTQVHGYRLGIFTAPEPSKADVDVHQQATKIGRMKSTRSEIDELTRASS